MSVFFMIFLSLGVLLLGENQVFSEKTDEKVVLKVYYKPVISQGPILIAIEEGFFAEQGLKVELVKLRKWTEAMPALINGDIDVISGAPGPGLFNAINQGNNIKMVADKNHVAKGHKTLVLMARKDLYDSGKLTKVEDLVGKRVSRVSNYDCTSYFLDKLFDAADILPERVELFRMHFVEASQALSTGAIDAAMLAEPFVTQLEMGGNAVIIIEADDILPGEQLTTITYGPRILGKDRELGKKFMVAFLKGVRQYREGKTDRNVDILTRTTGLEEVMVRACEWSPTYSDGHMNIETLMRYQEWLYKRGASEAILPKEDIIDTSFLDYANKALSE